MTDEYAKMTGPELVATYNAMVDRGLAAGMPAAAWRHVERFSGLDVGRTRCAKLETALEGVTATGRPSAEITAGVADASADANVDLRPNHLKANEQTRLAGDGESRSSTNKKSRSPVGEKKNKSHPAGKAADFRLVRAGTARARVIEAASAEGATLETVARAAGVDRKTLMAHLHCLGRDCAIGYETDGEAVRLLFPEGKSAAGAIKRGRN